MKPGLTCIQINYALQVSEILPVFSNTRPRQDQAPKGHEHKVAWLWNKTDSRDRFILHTVICCPETVSNNFIAFHFFWMLSVFQGG